MWKKWKSKTADYLRAALAHSEQCFPAFGKHQTKYGFRRQKSRSGRKKSDDGKSTGDPVKDGKKVIISDLSVTGGNINLAASLAGRATSASVPLPTIKMQDIGKEKGKNGAGIIDTLSVVLQKIFDTAYDTVVKSKLVDLKSAAEDSLNNVVNGIKEKSGLKDWFGFGK